MSDFCNACNRFIFPFEIGYEDDHRVICDICMTCSICYANYGAYVLPDCNKTLCPVCMYRYVYMPLAWFF